MSITLYHLEDCPYCHLVRRKLEFLGLPALVIPVKPLGADRKELKEKTGQSSVPALIDEGQVLVDSSVILEYLDKKYGPVEMPSNDYGIAVELEGEFGAIREKTIAALKEVGFGLLTEIDAQATIKKKIDKDLEPYSILGFCNPGYAYHGMTNEKDIGLLLPCNVLIRELKPGRFKVTALHPVKMFQIVGRADMMPLAKEVTALLKQAIATLGA